MSDIIPSQQYLTISRRALDVEDYIDIVRRHVSWILGPLFAGVVIATVVAFLLPNTYASTAIMRITPGPISGALVPSVINQQMIERIGQMQAEITSRLSLSELVQRPSLNLYPREKAAGTIEDVIEKMRTHDIGINIFSLAGQGGRPASAFSITFLYPERFKAQLVVQALVNRFLESMAAVQRSSGKETLSFLREEVTKSKAELDRLDTAITQFREQNAGRLPEEQQINMQILTGLQGQQGAINDALNRINEDKLTLETNLNTYKMQRDAYTNAATVTEASAAKVNGRLEQLNREIGGIQAGLHDLELSYTEKMPIMKNTRALLAIRVKERDELQAKEDAEAAKAKPAAKATINPFAQEHLVEIQGLIDMVQAQLRNKENERLENLKRLDQISKNMSVYESRLALVPANQQRYMAMVRERDSAQQTYQEFQRKQSLATASDHVEQAKGGETLEVLDAASLPESPIAPNRLMDIGVGGVLGLGLGIFLTGLKELKDGSLKNLKDVRAYTNLPILSSIPLLENDLLVRRKRRLAYVGWSAAVVLGMVAVCSSMYYHYFLIGT